jgi:hypothetical protein
MLTTIEPEYQPTMPLGQTEDHAPQRPTDEHGNFIYRIPEVNFPAVSAKIEKLNNRARRLGMNPIVVSEIGEDFAPERKRISDPFGGPTEVQEITVRFVKVTVVGQIPRIDGWTFAATIQHEDGGNLLRTCPGFDTLLPLHYRQADTQCEHCAKDRRRNDTYVLFNVETGAWKQVGRSCLADFLRTTSPQGVAEWAEIIAALDSEISVYEDDDFSAGDREGRKLYFGVQRLLGQVRCIVRQDGWCSRTEARNSFVPKLATVDHAFLWFASKFVGQQSPAVRAKYTPTEEDETEATAAIAWAQTLPADVANDYLWNIRVVAHKEFVDVRGAGLAGSIISAYNKHLERELAKKYESLNPSEYFGTPKAREPFRLTVVGIRELDREYGLTTMIRFKQEATNNTAIWWASGKPGFELDLDQTYTLTATVKKHDLYRGEQKQTVLTRVAPFVEKVKKTRKRKTTPATDETPAEVIQ